MSCKALHSRRYRNLTRVELGGWTSAALSKSATLKCGFQATNRAASRWCTNRFSLVQGSRVVQTFTIKAFSVFNLIKGRFPAPVDVKNAKKWLFHTPSACDGVVDSKLKSQDIHPSAFQDANDQKSRVSRLYPKHCPQSGGGKTNKS